ncbi:hypothetical protein [Escherichia coli]|uniref:hypothetical protein n=1 Tax=Escherichia coli TaxID=562 RepID=UPI000B65498E|nr:hypothetical protein [Escherichia coli]OUF84005.1 hypothetical protein AZ024_001470 [Escherichia coli]
MFSTNLIQSNYGDLNIKSLAFDSFKERLQSTMTALTFFISTGQCDCDEIAESNFNYMIAYMSNINYDASKPGAPALSFDTYLQDNVKYRVIINNLYVHPVGSIFAAIQKNESLLKFPSIISMLNINLLFNPLNLPGMGSGVLEDIMSIPDSSLRKRLGYEVLSFSLQAHSLSQECIDKLDIFFADDLFKYESVCIAAMEHLKSKATAPIQNGPLPA